MKAEMTAAQLHRAIEVTRPRIAEATARAQRETAPHIVAMFTRNAAEARNDLQVLEAKLTALTAAQSAKTPAPAKVEKQRCPHYGAIKEFFAVAREVGLDAQNKAGCRAAVGMLLGRRIESRADMDGTEWAFATNAVRMGRLFW